MSKIEVNAIEPQCGTTLTIGASDTSIAGIGTVNWDTTAKTTAFTAVSGRGYFVNTTSGAITVTLPATPNAGDIVSISDYAGTTETNAITVGRNGSNIEGVASDLTIENNGVALSFFYVDGTQGWKVINSGSENDKLPQPVFITATGGTVTCCGDYKIHTFTGPGTFTVTCAGSAAGSNTVDYMVVAGGGAGGSGYGGGGGGAGGFRESSGSASGSYSISPLGACVSALPVIAQGYPITVGAGGTGNPDGRGSIGSNSVFSTITSAGGGGGGTSGPAGPAVVPATADASAGGSGGGAGSKRCIPGPSGYTAPALGAGNTPPVSPPQGNPGGQAGTDGLLAYTATAGGGGATAAGATCQGPTSFSPGAGGAGATTSISGSSTSYAGGASGGGDYNPANNPIPGPGGIGGGGRGGSVPSHPQFPVIGNAGTAGGTNTGGGGGGASGPVCTNGSSGGSGIVIIRYKYQ